MTIFEYECMRASTEKVTGTINAGNYQDAAVKLHGSGLTILHIQEKTFTAVTENKPGRKIGHSILAGWTRQTAHLLNASVRLEAALKQTAGNIRDPLFREAVSGILKGIESGKSFSEQLAKSGYFPEWYSALVRSGEVSGRLDKVMTQAAGLLEREVKWRRKITAGLAYPLFVLGTGTVSLIVLALFVLPQLISFFDETGIETPLLLRLLTGPWLLKTMIVVPVFAAGYFGLLLKDGERRKKFAEKSLSVPLLGRLLIDLETERICRTLALLSGNAVPLSSALNVAVSVPSMALFKNIVKQMHQEISAGGKVADAMAKHKLFPETVIAVIRVNEAAGQIDKGFLAAADDLRDGIDHRMGNCADLLGPLILTLVVAVIGSVIISAAACIMRMDGIY